MSYAAEALRRIGEKAAPPPTPWDRSEWRMDAFHALKQWSKYGKRAKYGWEVDHTVPPSRGAAATWPTFGPCTG